LPFVIEVLKIKEFTLNTPPVHFFDLWQKSKSKKILTLVPHELNKVERQLYPMANKTSQHILNSAANLLGFCLIIITSLHIAEKTQNTLIDEFASIIAGLLTFSCIFSFASIKTDNIKRENIFERCADILFLAALSGVLIIITYLAIKLWNNWKRNIRDAVP